LDRRGEGHAASRQEGSTRAARVRPGFIFAGVVWWQKWELFQNVFVPGRNRDNSVEGKCDLLGLPPDLGGKRVLDIGAWNGCLSLKCERRGAREVIALSPEEPQATGFARLRDVLGSTRTQYLRGTIYNLDPEELGDFDVVLCCGVLYHLRYPMLGIDNLRRVCRGELFLETHVADGRILTAGEQGPRWARMGEAAPALAGTPLWQFYRFNELSNDCSNWFGPNTAAVLQALESAVFAAQLTARLEGSDWCRGVFRARVKPGIPEFLALPCTESVYYDTVVGHLYRGKKVPAPAPRWTLAERRGITDFPASGVGAEPEELLAGRPPIAEPAPAMPTLVGGNFRRLARKILRTVLRRSA
jgi:SAM-dependent methyltransferase